MRIMDADPLLTKKEAEKYLKISHQTLYLWMKHEGLPCFKVRRQLRFRKSELDEWLLTKRPDRKAD